VRRPPLFFRTWFWVLGALRVRPYRPGDGLLRYVLTEPWDAAYTLPGRAACRLLGWHNRTCRGMSPKAAHQPRRNPCRT
jgi:hypothetical protein